MNRLWTLAVVAGLVFGAGVVRAQHHGGGHPPPADHADHAGPPPATKAAGRFVDQTDGAGIAFVHRIWWNEQGPVFKTNHYDHGSGVLVADVNNDGNLDIYFLNQDGPNALFLAHADRTFSERAASWGVALDDRSCSGGAFGDYDNDGWVDLYVTTIRQGNVLFHNNGDGRFTDVTDKAGVGVVSHSTTATWVDLDADGFLDLYVGNQASWTTDEFDRERGYWVGAPHAMHGAESLPDVLFHNNGNGTFGDWTQRVGIVNDPKAIMGDLDAPIADHGGPPMPMPGGHDMPGMGGMSGMHERKDQFWTMDVAAGDYDNDGWTDLYVANGFGYDALYHNRRDGTLELTTRSILRRTPFGSFGATWADLDNNGLLDLYVVDMHSDMWCQPTMPIDPKLFGKRYNSAKGPQSGEGDATAPRPDHPYLYGNACYMNQVGPMDEVSQAMNLENWWPWGVVAADFDLDGLMDLFVPAGMSHPWDYSPNFLHLNRGAQGFEERAAALGLEPRAAGNYLTGVEFKFSRSTRAAAALDYDNDGDLDLVLANWNDRATLYENRVPVEGRHWVGFQLAGAKSNRGAVGAKVFVTRAHKTQAQQVRSASGYLSQSDPRMVFGLGDATAVDKVEVVWPGGRRQTVTDFHVDTYNRVVEAED